MSWFMEVKDKTERKIHLSTERWIHISREHPEVSPYLGELEEALRNPTRIATYPYDRGIRYFYKYFKQQARYLLVIVKYLNSHGFIITSYFVRHIK